MIYEMETGRCHGKALEMEKVSIRFRFKIWNDTKTELRDGCKKNICMIL
ncbi:hypothetical protein SAMN05216349_13122 [Oribacterium sp. KHPX15]|nr:hypothetical protein SAMN05216349_13122 [Oribacterium sp. KHPX15]